MNTHDLRISAIRQWRGFTLIELLVVVAIVGVLAAIAYPSYSQYVTRTNRSAAQSMLLQIADRQEQFFSDNKSYAATLTALGYPADAIGVNDEGAAVPAASADRLYAIRLSNTTAMTFTVNATPQLSQAARDGGCQTLTLTHTGLRGQTGPGNDCW